MGRRYIRWLLFGFISLPLATARADMPSPEPYLLVRSMRMLQDQVASGKPEALPMLNRVLGHIADQLASAKPEVWEKPANAYAIFVYLLNGGNPQVVRNILTSAKLDRISPRLIAGSLAYADGDSLRSCRELHRTASAGGAERTHSIDISRDCDTTRGSRCPNRAQAPGLHSPQLCRARSWKRQRCAAD